MINMDCAVCKKLKKNKKATHFSFLNSENGGQTFLCSKHFKVYGINKKGYFLKLSYGK